MAALTSVAIAEDPKLWHCIDQGLYDVVLASPEVLLGPRTWFWLKTVRNLDNRFCQRLRCIAIDEAHLIWGWRDFREKYQMIGHLKDVFPTVPTLMLSATITPNVLEYIRVSLKLPSPLRIYRQPLDRPNLTYMVTPIRNPGFEDLAFVIPRGGAVADIPKTMIFVDSIDKAVQMTKYLRSRLSERIRTTSRPDEIIRTFSANLTAASRTRFLQDLRSGETRVWVCTECAGLGINLRDILRSFQWKVSKHLTLPDLLQRLGRAGRDPTLQAVAMVFVNTSQILPDNVHTLESSMFKDLQLPVTRDNQDRITNVIAKLYRNNLEPKRETGGNAYETTDPALLWYINTSGWRRRMLLACFMCKYAFQDKSGILDCCDHCIYSRVETGNTPDFLLHDVTAAMTTRFEGTTQFAELRLAGERSRLLAANLTRTARTPYNLVLHCQEMLDRFAAETWPTNSMNELKFPIPWRQRLAKAAVQITTVVELRKELSSVCELRFSSLYRLAEILVANLVEIVQAHSVLLPAQQRYDLVRDILPVAPLVAPTCAQGISGSSIAPCHFENDSVQKVPPEISGTLIAPPYFEKDSIPKSSLSGIACTLIAPIPTDPATGHQDCQDQGQQRSQPRQRYKISSQYKTVIDFSSADAGSVTYNSSFECFQRTDSFRSTKNTQNKPVTYQKITPISVTKDMQRATKLAEREAKKVELATARKAKTAAKRAKVAETRDLIKAEAATKKIEDRAVKNLQSAAEKSQTAKRKAALSIKDGNASRKRQMVGSTDKNKENAITKEKPATTK